MKKTPAIVIIIGCLLLLANISVAAGSVVNRIDLAKKEIEKPIQEKDYQLEDDSTASLSEENKDIAPRESKNLVTNEEETEHFVVQPRNLVIPNSKPVVLTLANAGGPYAGKIDEPITFDASKSLLIFGAVYKWDFGDGIVGYGLHTTHVYSTPDIYHATLTVIKSNGNTYMDIAPVYIDQDGDHLRPYGGCRYKADVNEVITFDGSQSISTDPDAPITEWIWHFGDGTVGYGEKVTHSYSKGKVYLVTLEARDSNGNMRQDVMHADIDHEYTCIEDFFITSDSELKNILDILLTRLSSLILYPLLSVKIYTNYNGYEQNIPLDSGYLLPLSIDVNHDGDSDVKVNNLNFFKPVISKSPFNSFSWFAFETTLSDIEKISNDIKTEDDFTICLQFSLQILEDYLGLEESIIRIGYHSSSGEEKPSSFSATHIFRPYIIYRLLNGNNNQVTNQDMSAYPVVQSTTTSSMQTTTQSIQSSPLSGKMTNGQQQPLMQGVTGGAYTQDIGTENVVASSSEEENLQKKPFQPTGDEGKLIPENGIRLESTNADHFSFIISFIGGSTKTTFAATFESFTTTTLMHRRSELIRDVDLNGADDSALTLSITRENQQGVATLGILINPFESFGFHIDISRLPNDARHIEFNIDNPPENIVLFTRSENEQGEEISNYVYMKNIPSSLTFDLLPRLTDGYISVAREGSNDFRVGITDDLEDPDADIYVSALPMKETRIDWSILSEDYNTIELSSTTLGLSLHGELKVEDENQEVSTIVVDATANSNLDMSLQWSLLEGYFELRRSPIDIDFDFSLAKQNELLDVSGNFQGGPGRGFRIDFSGLETGKIEITNDFLIDVTIHAQNLETELDTGLLIDNEGDVKLEWNQSVELNLASDVDVELSDLTLSNPDGSITADNILLGGGINILLKPSEKYYEITSSRYFQIETLAIEYQNILDFSVESLEMNHATGVTRTSWFDFSSNPKFKIESSRDIDITNLHLSIGDAVDFDIPNLEIVNNDGSIYVESDDSSLFMETDVDFSWDITIETQAFGNWEAQGNIEGSISMNAEWDDGSGSVEFDIEETGIAHTFEIIHDDLTLNFGTFNFEPGTITFEWQPESNTNIGKFNILNNGVDGDLTGFKITYDDNDDPIEIELLNVSFASGNTYINWTRFAIPHYLIIDNGVTLNVEAFKIKWGSKIVTFDILNLGQGKFYFGWDMGNDKKEIQIKNSISSFGPSVSYEDLDQNLKLSASLCGLNDDYKCITLRGCKDQDGNISGLYLDSGGTQLATWIQFEAIKGDFGRRIKLLGLQVDGFCIKKNGSGNIEVSGKIWLVNGLIYSKLVNDEWKDLEILWDIDGDGVGSIEFTTDPAFNDNLEINYATFKGTTITATFELPQYLKFDWDVDFDLNGHVDIDTDNESIYEISFTMQKDTSEYEPRWGVYIYGNGLTAENYKISWNFSDDPGSWKLTETGWLEPGSIEDVHIAWNEQWYDILLNGQPTSH